MPVDASNCTIYSRPNRSKLIELTPSEGDPSFGGSMAGIY